MGTYRVSTITGQLVLDSDEMRSRESKLGLQALGLTLKLLEHHDQSFSCLYSYTVINFGIR